MATQQLPGGDNQDVSRAKKVIPYRAVFGKKFITATYAQIFAAANWPGNGLDLADAAAKAPDAGESIYNNFILNERKPRFSMWPEAIGVHMTDPGNERVKSWLAENARLVLKVGNSELIKEPVIALPPGLGVLRAAESNTSGDNIYSEQHGIPSPSAAGVHRFAPDLVLDTMTTIEARLFLDPDARAALAGLSGSVPPQGWFIGLVLYGSVAAPAGLTLS